MMYLVLLAAAPALRLAPPVMQMGSGIAPMNIGTAQSNSRVSTRTSGWRRCATLRSGALGKDAKKADLAMETGTELDELDAE